MIAYPIVNRWRPAPRLGQVPEPAPAEPRRFRGAGVEVRDVRTGAFIANARVSVLDSKGVTFTTKTTGPDGKAFFAEAEIPEDVTVYRVEAEGYSMQERPFVALEVVPFSLEKPGFLGIPTWGWIAGIAAVGLTVWIATRK